VGRRVGGGVGRRVGGGVGRRVGGGVGRRVGGGVGRRVGGGVGRRVSGGVALLDDLRNALRVCAMDAALARFLGAAGISVLVSMDVTCRP